jgi:hypothetical protein
VAYAAALRIARFHTRNEFSDWDTALHTFTFANAVHQGLRRTGSPELLGGVFDAAMSVYLDHFLNVPAAPLSELEGTGQDRLRAAARLPALLDRQQQVNEAGALVVGNLTSEGTAWRVADGIAFPNGMAVTPDNSTLIVAESYSKRLTAFDIAADGGVSNRRLWANLDGGVADGICVDAEGHRLVRGCSQQALRARSRRW